MIYAYGDDIQPYRADDIPSLSAWIKKIQVPKGLGFFGASDLTRTGDLLITSEMHYRLCYTSKPVYYSRYIKYCQLFFTIAQGSIAGQLQSPAHELHLCFLQTNTFGSAFLHHRNNR